MKHPSISKIMMSNSVIEGLTEKNQVISKLVEAS